MCEGRSPSHHVESKQSLALMATWGTTENHAGLFEIKQKPQRCNNNRNEKQCKNGHKICHAQRFKKLAKVCFKV